MALTDFDAPQPGYAYSGTYNPDGSLATKYVAGGVLPNGYNRGEFNPDGTLKWASLYHPPTDPARFALPQPASAAPYGTPASMPQPINLSTLFSNKTASPLFASTKSAVAQGGVNDAYRTRATNQKAEAQSLTDFAKGFIQSRGKVDQYGNEEQNAISRVYGTGPGSMEAQLAELNRQEQNARSMAAESAMNRAGRANSVRRLQGGNSSYLDRLFAQDLNNIAVAGAGQAAQQGRADLQYLNANRQGLVGQRQKIIDSILNRNFAPVEAAQRMEGNNLGLLNTIANLDYGNNIYEAPEDAYTKRLNFLQDLVSRGYA